MMGSTGRLNHSLNFENVTVKSGGCSICSKELSVNGTPVLKKSKKYMCNGKKIFEFKLSMI